MRLTSAMSRAVVKVGSGIRSDAWSPGTNLTDRVGPGDVLRSEGWQRDALDCEASDLSSTERRDVWDMDLEENLAGGAIQSPLFGVWFGHTPATCMPETPPDCPFLSPVG